MANKKTPKKKPQKELYAGPTFLNSPCPSTLPVPDFSSSSFGKESISFSPRKESPRIKESPLLKESPPQELHDDVEDEMFPMETHETFDFVHQNGYGKFPSQYQNGYPIMPYEQNGNGLHNGYGYQYGIQPNFMNTQQISNKITSDTELDQMSKNLKNILGL
jgi:hypothetical protein